MAFDLRLGFRLKRCSQPGIPNRLRVRSSRSQSQAGSSLYVPSGLISVASHKEQLPTILVTLGT